MARRGRRRGLRPAPVLPACLLAGVLATGLPACSTGVDRVAGLDTRLDGVDGVTEAEVTASTGSSEAVVAVVVDRGLDAPHVVGVLRDVTGAAAQAGFAGYRLEVRRSLVDADVLVVDETFAGSEDAGVVTENWVRVTDAVLGEVTYAFQPGTETIAVESGGGIGHDVAEVSRIGYGWSDTTWRFGAGPAAFVVSGRVSGRDVILFDRVQRTVASSVLPVPATRWQLQRRAGHLDLDLEVRVSGGTNPVRISPDRWAGALRPLLVAAVRSTRYPDRARWIQVSDVATGARDTFASWSSQGRPVRGRDLFLRGWDAWWERLARRA